MPDELRERLIVRILRMRPDLLLDVERLLTDLECGNSLPLSGDPQSLGPKTLRQAATIKSGDENATLAPVPRSIDWPHAPLHRLSDHGAYIVTTGTFHKEHWFRGPERLDFLESALLRVMKNQGWRLEAWAVFSNHYHCRANAESGAEPLSTVLKQLHGETAREANLLDHAPSRTVWHNFWDTELT